MNKTHKSIWNDSLGTYVAVSEATASGGSKTSSTRKLHRHPGRSPTQRLALEPRIVFDGAMAVEGLTAVERQILFSALAPSEPATVADNQPIVLRAAVPPAVVKEAAQADTKAPAERLATELASPTKTAALTTEIVFVSADVGDLQTFLTNRPGTEVVILDPDRDGMALMPVRPDT